MLIDPDDVDSARFSSADWIDGDVSRDTSKYGFVPKHTGHECDDCRILEHSIDSNVILGVTSSCTSREKRMRDIPSEREREREREGGEEKE
jgi:hypothetical protein